MKTFEKLVIGTLLVSLVGLGATGVSAYDENRKFRAYGPAHEPCSEFDALRDRRLPGYTKEQHEAIEVAIDYWISGWATAWNYFSKDTYDMTGGYNFNDLVEQIEKYCERNPNEKLMDAVIIVSYALVPWRTKKEPMAKSN